MLRQTSLCCDATCFLASSWCENNNGVVTQSWEVTGGVGSIING